MPRLFSIVRISISDQVRRSCSSDKSWGPGAMTPCTARRKAPPHTVACRPAQRERSESASAGRAGGVVAHAVERGGNRVRGEGGRKREARAGRKRAGVLGVHV